MRKKNRKLRRLRELYPEINIKLFYARDFRALMLKYGKVALVDGLSGSSGQVLAARARARTATRRAPIELRPPRSSPADPGRRPPPAASRAAIGTAAADADDARCAR